MTGRDRSGIAVGGCSADLITLDNGDACPALGEEVCATDPNDATTDNDDVAIT